MDPSSANSGCYKGHRYSPPETVSPVAVLALTPVLQAALAALKAVGLVPEADLPQI